ncbi:hypothetical protein BUALT_Bualt07G0129900 [Buddleja alternifolia]|uniref:Threonylcarbamoyl-AMP synthase n=1 Tax=Buddleja alternifolia TaxID=168488 RepID=A0AAV6XGV3_9LAMI|nr:hypothetical protein BUALT_Bualt07G0129900 [Buddleja alternifolia]
MAMSFVIRKTSHTVVPFALRAMASPRILTESIANALTRDEHGLVRRSNQYFSTAALTREEHGLIRRAKKTLKAVTSQELNLKSAIFVFDSGVYMDEISHRLLHLKAFITSHKISSKERRQKSDENNCADKIRPDTYSAPFLLLSISTLHRRSDIGGVCARSRMAWSLEKCDGISVENAKMGLVRPATEDYAEEAIGAVKAGEVIAVPTDTLYGFACDACSVDAVHRIYETKGRKYTSPLAICVGDVKDIQRFADTDHLPNGLLDSLLPGPVTVVLKRGESSILEKSLNPGLDSIGVRVPDCNFIRAIARGSGSALALTSANLSGEPSSVDVKDFEKLWEHCAYIYNGGVLPSGRAGSTVVDLTKLGQYKILRPGRSEPLIAFNEFLLEEANKSLIAEEETIVILERFALVQDGSVS